MSPSSEAVHTSRRISAATLLIVVAMLISAAVVFSARETIRPQPAAAESHKRVHGTHGKGYVIDGQWIGTWHTQDGTGFCIEFDKDHPDSTGAGQLGGRVPGMSTEDSERVKYVANHYGRTNSKVDGAAAAIVVWKTQDTRRFNSYYAKLLKTKKVSKAIRDRMAEIAAEAANHGPYKLTMTMGSGVVGQSDAGVVTVRTQKGKAVSRRAVVLTARSNGTLVRQDKTTDAKGRLAFSVKVTGTGAVRVDAKLVSPAPGGVLMTRPSAGHQRLVLAGKTMESASSTVSTQRSVNGPALSRSGAGHREREQSLRRRRVARDRVRRRQGPEERRGRRHRLQVRREEFHDRRRERSHHALLLPEHGQELLRHPGRQPRQPDRGLPGAAGLPLLGNLPVRCRPGHHLRGPVSGRKPAQLHGDIDGDRRQRIDVEQVHGAR
jgi:hypothetical protein